MRLPLVRLVLFSLLLPPSVALPQTMADEKSGPSPQTSANQRSNVRARQEDIAERLARYHEARLQAFREAPANPARQLDTFRRVADDPDAPQSLPSLSQRRLLRRYYAERLGLYPMLDVQRALEEAYIAGRFDEQTDRARIAQEADFAARRERLLTHHERATREGVALLRAGEYARAVVPLSLAGELNQGDPACRLHLAQARLALGHFDEAGKLARRALQLQPALRYADLQLDRYFPADGSLESFTAQLRAHAADRAASPEALFMLGFCEFQLGRYAAAHAALRRAKRVFRDDPATDALLEITRPAQTEAAPQAGAAASRR